MVGGANGVQIALACFIGAFAVSYAAMRLLWGSIAATGVLRGIILAAPIVGLAAFFAAAGLVGMGVALAMASAVLMLTLGTGVAAAGRPEFDHTMDAATPHALRLVAPLAACACAAGFAGHLTLTHLAAVTIIGALTLWCSVEHFKIAGSWNWPRLGISAALLGTAVVLIVIAARQFQAAAGAMVVTPLVVLLAAPAILLSLMGLLSTESTAGRFAAAGDTVAGFVVAALSIALPITIAIGLVRQSIVEHFGGKIFEHFHIQLAQSPVMMPVATWRIDSLLLLVVAVLLAPAAAGRFRLGRLEGIFLVGLYLTYAAIASRSGYITQ